MVFKKMIETKRKWLQWSMIGITKSSLLWKITVQNTCDCSESQLLLLLYEIGCVGYENWVRHNANI